MNVQMRVGQEIINLSLKEKNGVLKFRVSSSESRLNVQETDVTIILSKLYYFKRQFPQVIKGDLDEMIASVQQETAFFVH